MEFSFVDDDRFVWARLSGQWTLDKMEFLLEAILEECGRRNQEDVLIDFTGVGNEKLSFFERVRMGLGILRLKGKLGKVAVAGPSQLIDREKIGERLARNRGLNLLVFSDLDAAQRWLVERP